MKSIFTLIISSLFFIAMYGQNTSQEWKDVNYVGDGKGFHNLDIYLPSEIKDSYPVIIYIYGSAWLSNNGKGADMTTVGAALLNAGYAVVTPNHRSSSDAIFPAQIHDIKAVIRFVRGAASQYKFDTSFVGISGSSSGGHLASLAGTTNGVGTYTVGSASADIEGNLGAYTDYSSSVDAVVDWFGPTDLTVISSCINGDGFDHDGPSSPGSAIIGAPITQNPDKAQLLNPITYVDPTDPPFLLFHGTVDKVVPYCQSEMLNSALNQAGVQSEYVSVPGGDHGGGVTQSAANLAKMVALFDEVKEAKASTVITQYSVTVTGGFGSGEYAEGKTVTIEANSAPQGQVFSEWSGDDILLLDNVNATVAHFTMPAKNVSFSAVFENNQVDTYTVTVTGGTGSGEYEEGKVVTIKAEVPEGKQFVEWSGNGVALLDYADAAEASFTMPGNDVSLNAVLKNIAQEKGIVLKKGWNLVGYPYSGRAPIEQALSSVWQSVEVVKDADSFYKKDQAEQFNLLDELQFSKGYFVKVAEDCELIW